jgi:hypothetical protein
VHDRAGEDDGEGEVEGEGEGLGDGDGLGEGEADGEGDGEGDGAPEEVSGLMAMRSQWKGVTGSPVLKRKPPK